MATSEEVLNAARSDWKKGMKYKDIAAKYGVTESAVKSWASRYWRKGSKNSKVATDKRKKSQSKVATRGGQPGNRNACGNNGGAPVGNSNAVKHGGYSAVYWDTLSEEERYLIDNVPQDEQSQLIDQIRLCYIRERRALKAIELINKQEGSQVLLSVSRNETKRSFKDDEERELYNELMQDKVDNNQILPGEPYQLYTSTESKVSALLRLESELTRTQNAKTKAITALAKLNLEKEKLAMIRENEDTEVEDTSETDGVIYG